MEWTGLCVGTPRRASRSERAWKRTPIHQQVLPGDEAGLRRAQEGAGCAELVRLAEPAGRDDGNAFVLGLLDADAALLRRGREVGFQAVGLELPRQQEVDGDVRSGNRT